MNVDKCWLVHLMMNVECWLVHLMMNLHTLLVEVERILNSRSLTSITFAEKMDMPLTPNDLLLLSPDVGLPVTETTSADAHFKNRWKQVQFYADVFW